MNFRVFIESLSEQEKSVLLQVLRADEQERSLELAREVYCNEEERRLVDHGDTIYAIRGVRERTGLPLIAYKFVVEKYKHRM